MKTGLVALVILAFTTMAFGQLVSVGPPDTNYCAKQTVRPNLVVEQDAEVFGRVIDGSGEPLRASAVELRSYVSPTKQTLAKRVMTDAEGRFHLGTVKADKYRLVASATRLFEQPVNLRCGNKECELSIILQATGTDLPYNQCPVR